MNTITIPRKLADKGDLVVIPREEYEAFSKWQKMFKTFRPTARDVADLRRARADYKAGRTMTVNELRRKLAIKN